MSSLFGGGGGQQAATAIPAATPPVSQNAAEVVQAQQDLRRQALKKRGYASTYLAGETGGFQPGKNPVPSPTNPRLPTNSYGGQGAKTLGGA